MLIKTLVENTAATPTFGCEHGLCLYIETKTHKLLFDTGASDLFTENAQKMDVDLSQVDLVVISHGHNDHGGGLSTFMQVNQKAKIYVQQTAFGQYYSHHANGENGYIGLNQSLLSSDRFVFTQGRLMIDDELSLFSSVKGNRLRPSGNHDLLMKTDDSFVRDDFSHEQNLVITEGTNTLLVAGCAHNGIVNVLEHFQAEYKTLPSHVIGGFHLHSSGSNTNEDAETVAQIGRFLADTHAQCYTCHCTGIESYHRLKAIMGEQINYLSSGSQLTI
ncbi:MAG: MBL fold metallo-hydrolase [Acetanaerobacterium sp.]